MALSVIRPIGTPGGIWARAAVLTAALASLAGCGGVDKQQQARDAYTAGYHAIQRGDYLDAERQLKLAQPVFPKNAFIWLNLGVAAQQQKHDEEARADYQKAVDLGAHEMPLQITDPAHAGESVADLARDNLKTLSK